MTDDGEVVSLVVTVREVSLQRERERKLRRYRRVVETMDDIAFVVDEEWNVEFTTESVLDYVGVSLDALEDQPVMDLARKFIVEDDGPTRFEQALDRAFDGTHPSESPERVELTLDANGERVTFEYQFSPLVVEGETEAVIVTMRDITERRNREQDLRRQNEQRDEFASVVSHDLQNPLRVAEGHLELARDDCESEHLDAVAQAHDRMDTLIDDLLTLARGKKAIIDTKPVDLMETVEACWANVETADVSLAIEDSRTIDADENCLRQVFENLIRNAVEHGGENVIVGALSDGFYVEDDGPGIPTDERDDVFDAGYSTSEEGTGFGLRIVKEMVEAHGWEVHIADGSEGGARVEVTDVEFASE